MTRGEESLQVKAMCCYYGFYKYIGYAVIATLLGKAMLSAAQGDASDDDSATVNQTNVPGVVEADDEPTRFTYQQEAFAAFFGSLILVAPRLCCRMIDYFVEECCVSEADDTTNLCYTMTSACATSFFNTAYIILSVVTGAAIMAAGNDNADSQIGGAVADAAVGATVLAIPFVIIDMLNKKCGVAMSSSADAPYGRLA